MYFITPNQEATCEKIYRELPKCIVNVLDDAYILTILGENPETVGKELIEYPQIDFGYSEPFILQKRELKNLYKVDYIAYDPKKEKNMAFFNTPYFKTWNMAMKDLQKKVKALLKEDDVFCLYNNKLYHKYINYGKKMV